MLHDVVPNQSGVAKCPHKVAGSFATEKLCHEAIKMRRKQRTNTDTFKSPPSCIDCSVSQSLSAQHEHAQSH
ncbi:hypothetical protein RB13234 [Rhodopirellula baltica SH 1]|uniref:Uncharacterized protein n=1 Tax=Rhodopirellula baltica (strain DSM 10527 / NCIMB 13988 / SH1) TaxID=243090 RepID=Q7UHF7_RHOBA|nr:hypothetical protein RB13234 [Rhodopirellula baltica SH 1]